MRILLALLCMVALALVIVPSCLAFGSGTGLDQSSKNLMLTGTVLWFAAATPFVVLRQPASATPRRLFNP
jgi:uncharacterized RDD family membrane protein YckC